MNPARPLLADAVLVLHFAIVVFVVGGLLIVLWGNRRRWRWVNGLWFRLSHLGAIAVVVAESWLGITCPLTALESWLRHGAGAIAYPQSFVQTWLHRLLYFDAPAWVFALAYTLFGLLVALLWWVYPPAAGRRSDQDRA